MTNNLVISAWMSQLILRGSCKLNAMSNRHAYITGYISKRKNTLIKNIGAHDAYIYYTWCVNELVIEMGRLIDLAVRASP